MKNKLSTLAVAALFSLTAVSASAAQTITYNGIDYLLNTESIAYYGSESRFQANPWWGNGLLANQLSELYHPDNQNIFAYSFPGTNYVDGTHWLINHENGSNYEGINSISLNGNEVANYVFGSVAAVPEADTSAMLLMGAGVMGFIARRRRQVAA